MTFWLAINFVPSLSIESARAACQLTQVTELPTHVVADTVLVPVQIDGKTAEMGLQVGAAIDTIVSSSAAYMHLPVHSSLNGPSIYAPDFRLGSIRAHNKLFLVALGGGSWLRTEPLYKTQWIGQIGPSLLWQYDVEFDLAHNHVLLFTPNSCEKPFQPWRGLVLSLPFETSPGMPFSVGDYSIRIPVTVSGHETVADLRSSGPTQMQWTAARRFGISSDSRGLKKIESEADSDGDFHPDYDYTLDSLTIGAETISHAPVVIISKFWSSDEGAYSIALGNDFFMRNRVYISFKDHMLYFAPNALLAAETDAPSTASASPAASAK